MGGFLLRWLVVAIALGVTAYVLPGVHVGSFGSLVVAALVLGLINAIVKPVLVILTLPLTILTLGIFYLILNALLFWLASAIVPGFRVDGFGWALLGALIVGLISMLLGKLS